MTPYETGPRRAVRRTPHRLRQKYQYGVEKPGWDSRLARIWGALLILGFLLPVSHTGAFTREGRFLFSWDVAGMTDDASAIWVFLPLVQGAIALLVAGAASKRLRGAMLLVSGLCVALLPLLVSGNAIFGPFANEALRVVALGLVAVLAPPAIAGANHVVRRGGKDPFGRILMGLGGVALLLVLFLPLQSGQPSIMGSLFGSRGGLAAANVTWPMIIWILIVLIYAVVAALFLFPTLNARACGAWLSMAGRFALYGLPVAIIALFMASGAAGRPGFFPILIVLAGMLLRLYGMMILMALGLALILDRTPAEEDPKVMVEAF